MGWQLLGGIDLSNIMWRRVKPLVDRSSLVSIERKYGINIPSKLKEIIIENNGGRPNPSIFKPSSGEEVQVKMLLSYNEEDTETIYNCIAYFKEHFGNDLLPFASEASGDYFCIKLSNGSVVLWHQEGNRVNELASSIDEFLNNLYIL
jgi:hypothetical protein